MKKFVPGGVVIAALCASLPAIAQTAPSSPPAAHLHKSFFNSNQSRAQVPAHLQKMFAGA